MTEMTTVPVTIGFDHEKVIGELRIDRSKLPPAPNYVFSLGYSPSDNTAMVDAMRKNERYIGPYELKCVAVIEDENYAGFLRQNGLLPGDAAT